MAIFKKTLKVFLFVLAFMQWSVASATSILQMDVDEMLASAEIIFEGQVTEVESRWNSNRTAINTFVTFEVFDVIHGSYQNQTLELRFAGGSADDLTMQVHGMIYPELGEQGIYFVEDSTQVYVNPIVGWSQGHFLIRKDANGNQKMHTAMRQPITDMTNESPQVQAFSQGVAAGVRTRKSVVADDSVMLKSTFKNNLKNRLISLKKK